MKHPAFRVCALVAFCALSFQAQSSVPPPLTGFPFTDEDLGSLNRRPSFQIRLQCSPGRQRERHRPLLVPLAEPEDHGTAPLSKEKIGQFKMDEVRDPAAGVQE